MIKDAFLSKDRLYRYALWRVWDDSVPQAMFIGLNPSTADESNDDKTLRRCISFSKAWGYGGVCMANLFAFRATDPDDMKLARDPVGPENDSWIIQLASEADIVVAAWGNHGVYRGRANAVKELVEDLHYLNINASGEPKHPLFVKSGCKPKKWGI